MEEQRSWVPYSQLDWQDPKFNKFSVDTRDFCCGYNFQDKPHPDFDKLKKYPHFFNTEQEVVSLLDRWKEESGGECEWRYLSINGHRGWSLKYLRIWRTDLGFIVCDSEDRALKKSELSQSILQEHLNAH